ncbi:hypothetical protein DPMN_179619 [Dreissena polymorpha]|uniref:Uncharacterized protein n=1 Tax=Dreissena polymorpha TaxID=45954 RepID=A0A9D4EGG6_DREPO|nr:hypothetical protein DPMN_179619 [Dreissena polymorpha]
MDSVSARPECWSSDVVSTEPDCTSPDVDLVLTGLDNCSPAENLACFSRRSCSSLSFTCLFLSDAETGLRDTGADVGLLNREGTVSRR